MIELTETAIKFRCPKLMVEYLDWKAEQDMAHNPDESLIITKSDIVRKLLFKAMREDLGFQNMLKEQELKEKLLKKAGL